MKKRYWFVYADYVLKDGRSGGLNVNIETDKNNPFSHNYIRDCIVRNSELIDRNSIVVSNFIEFKNREDYISFWE